LALQSEHRTFRKLTWIVVSRHKNMQRPLGVQGKLVASRSLRMFMLVADG
jgi:hypothetical protein